MKIGDQVFYEDKQAAISQIKGDKVNLAMLGPNGLYPVTGVPISALSDSAVESAEVPDVQPEEVTVDDVAPESNPGWFGKKDKK